MDTNTKIVTIYLWRNIKAHIEKLHCSSNYLVSFVNWPLRFLPNEVLKNRIQEQLSTDMVSEYLNENLKASQNLTC